MDPNFRSPILEVTLQAGELVVGGLVVGEERVGERGGRGFILERVGGRVVGNRGGKRSSRPPAGTRGASVGKRDGGKEKYRWTCSWWDG